jgi:hypothetical protein
MIEVIRTRTAPEHWSRAWLGLWTAVVVILFVGVFVLPWGAFAILFAIGFGIPEFIGLRREGDGYPPLTHVTRHFVAGWLAFPLLYGMLGLWGGKALAFPPPWEGARVPTVVGDRRPLRGPRVDHPPLHVHVHQRGPVPA